MTQYVVVYHQLHDRSQSTRTATFTADDDDEAHKFGVEYVKSIGRLEKSANFKFVSVREIH